MLLLGAGAFFAIRANRAKDASPVRYETAVVDRGHVASKVTATGTLSAIVTVLVGSQVSGRIDSIRADFNSPVKKGQVIATLDPALFQAAVEQGRANLTTSRANLEQARAQAADAEKQFARQKTLVEQKLVAQADFDTAEVNLRVAKARVSAAEASVAQASASLHQAEINLKYTTIVSPIDGVVISRSVDVGQTVAASLQAPTLFTIAQDLTKMQVDTNVAEGDVGKIQADMPVMFTVDAYPGRKFEGKVRQVRDAAQTVQNVVTYDAVIDVENPERLLKPGMTATVTFISAEKDDVLRVPNAALRFRPDPATLAVMTGASASAARSASPVRTASAPEGSARRGGARPRADSSTATRTVWVLRDEQPVAVTITPGLSDGSLTEVVTGELHPGDKVITEASTSGGGAGGSGGGAQRRMF